MVLLVETFVFLCLCAVLQGIQQMPLVPCQFKDESYSLDEKGLIDTHVNKRASMLQFGKTGDAPVNPNAITFLVTGSKLDLRRYIGVEPEQVECELSRYRTEQTPARWPVQGATEYDRWFICTLKHTKDLFIVTSFLRLPSDQPSTKLKHGNWPPIADGEILATTAVMVMTTQTPSVKAKLGAQSKLHCQFAVDHKGANLTVAWHRQHRGEKTRLFSHSPRTGEKEGSGVGMRSLAGGDATYDIPVTKIGNDGLYICSVSVPPLLASQKVQLHIEEDPKVSLNVGPVLWLQMGQDQKVVCNAENYYPLDVEIVWNMQDKGTSGQRVGAPLPEKLKNTLLSSHKHNTDKTYSISSFFYLTPSLKDEGKQFTCSVYHRSLRVPIKKSFILNVQEPSSWFFIICCSLLIILLLVVLYFTLPILNRGRNTYVRNKPY